VANQYGNGLHPITLSAYLSLYSLSITGVDTNTVTFRQNANPNTLLNNTTNTNYYNPPFSNILDVTTPITHNINGNT